jgi:hypothetical protein
MNSENSQQNSFISGNTVSRRTFMKRTGAASIAVLALSQSVQATEPAHPYSGTEVYKKYRLKCTSSPTTDDGTVGWSETVAPTPQNQNPTPAGKNMTLTCSGPAQNAISSSALTAIEGTLASSLITGTGTESSQPKLGIAKDPAPPASDDEDLSYNPYGGGWILVGQPSPVLYFKTSGLGLPTGTVGLSLKVDGTTATANVTAQGYIFTGLTVTQGVTKTNDTKYENTNSKNLATKAAAEASLGGTYNGQAGLSTDFIGTNHKWSVEANGKFTGEGTLNKEEQYNKVDAGGGTFNWQATGQVSSSVNGTLVANWTVVVQISTKTVRYEGGEVVSTTVSNWEPGGDPAPQP